MDHLNTRQAINEVMRCIPADARLAISRLIASLPNETWDTQDFSNLDCNEEIKIYFGYFLKVRGSDGTQLLFLLGS